MAAAVCGTVLLGLAATVDRGGTEDDPPALAVVAMICAAGPMLLLLGTCVAELGPPYQPFVEPVEALLAAQVGPDVLGRIAGRAAMDDSPEPDTRRELYDAVVDAVRAVAASGPVVLALEDGARVLRVGTTGPVSTPRPSPGTGPATAW